ncbi:MAG: glycosyltransferase family 4 protein [Deltaproteobacteria bacterium]|nr:glycosyltransferase family 4 protein [Deltaproteobacteria bacterium]
MRQSQSMMERQILFYFDNTRLGPSQRALLALIDALGGEKFALRFLLPDTDGALFAALRARGFEPDVLAMPATLRQALSSRGGVRGWLAAAYALLAYYRKLFRYFKMYDFGLVHSDGLRAHLLTIGIKIRFNVPLVWQLWSIMPQSLGLRLFCNLAAVFSDYLVASSMYVAHQMGRSTRWRKRLSVLYRGYDSVRLSPIAAPAARPVLAAVSSHENPNGYKVFLLAFALARRELPDLRAVVLVEGSDPATVTRIEDFGRAQNLGDFLSVQPMSAGDGAVGIAPELTRRAVMAYVNASVDLAPFHSDVAEAMGAGVPVVASRIGVLAELILSESTGLLFAPGDAKELAVALVRLATDQQLRSQLAINARHEFTARFGIQAYTQAIARIYADYLPAETGEAAENSPQKKAA